MSVLQRAPVEQSPFRRQGEVELVQCRSAYGAEQELTTVHQARAYAVVGQAMGKIHGPVYGVHRPEPVGGGLVGLRVFLGNHGDLGGLQSVRQQGADIQIGLGDDVT